MDLLLIEQLIRMVNMSSLSCLEVEEQGVRIRLENQILSPGVGTGAVSQPGVINSSGVVGLPSITGQPSVMNQPVVAGVSDAGLGSGSAALLQNGGISPASRPQLTPQKPSEQGISAVVPEQDGNIIYIKSPLVGTYYSTQALGYDPVEAGDKVTERQAVCAVEAMKLMNVIETDVAGEILEFMVEEGAMVEYGQNLVKIRKDS